MSQPIVVVVVALAAFWPPLPVANCERDFVCACVRVSAWGQHQPERRQLLHNWTRASASLLAS